jgi:hypothetical protein
MGSPSTPPGKHRLTEPAIGAQATSKFDAWDIPSI